MDVKEWSDVSCTLDEILKEFSPPLTVLVDEGYMLDENESLAAGQVITIQSKETLMQFKGYDAENKKVCIPVNFPFKVKVVSQLEGRLFNNIGEITSAKPPAKFVKLLSKGQKELANVIKGDRLKILLTERDKQGPTFLHLRNQNGKHLRLSVGFNGKFCECGESDEEYMVKDLVYRKLPFSIKFVVNNEKSKIGDLVGIIKITEITNETLTFCTAYSSGKRFMAAFPVTFDVKVRPVKTWKVDNEDSNKSTIGSKRFERLRQSILIENLVDDGNQVRFLSLEEKDCKHDSSPSTTQENSTGQMEELPNKISNELAEKIDGELIINRNDPKRKSTGFLSKVKSKLRGTKSNGNKPKRKRPEIVVMRDSSGACSDGGDSGIYEEISNDTYVSMDVVDGIRRTLGRTSSSPVKKPAVSIGDMPPPLPGNHPIERRHTVCMKNSSKAKLDKNIEQEVQRDKENFRKFYECMRKSEQELKDLDMEDIAEILKQLKLGKYVRRFKENKIDGKLLVDLDEAVFRDMELTPFESRKLRKYVFGWRPDNDGITDSKYIEPKDNLNATLWSEDEVEAHMNSLGMNEFASFCKDNQVNGDLLWDIVVDEDMVFGLLNGKDRKLNSIKLKNYVIEGWRPKLSKKQSSIDGSTTKVRSKSFNSGKKSSMDFEKNKTAKITSNYERAAGKSRITSSTQVSKANSKDADRGTIKTREIASARSTTPANQRASSLYERPASAPYLKHVSSSKANGADSRSGHRKQASTEYEVPVTRTASCRRMNTLSKQRSTENTNTYEEPLKKLSSTRSKTVGKSKGSFGEASSNEVPGRTETTQPLFSSKQTVSKSALSSQSMKVSKPGTAPSKAEATKKSDSRSVTPTSSTTTKGDSPRVVDFNAETRPRSKFHAKVTYPLNSPYGKKGVNANEVGKGNDKKDAKQELKLKTEENGKRMEICDKEIKRTTIRSSGDKGPEGKNWQKKVTGNGNKTDKEKGTAQIKQDNSCKNAKAKAAIAPSQTKPQQVHLSNPKEVKKVEKQNSRDAHKQSDTFRAKRESKTGEPAVSSKIKGATSTVIAEKSKNIERQRQIQGVKEVKRSFVNSVIEKYDQKQAKTQILKTDLKINAKGASRTNKENDDETKILEDDAQKVRKSVAQLKKQFDRT